MRVLRNALIVAVLGVGGYFVWHASTRPPPPPPPIPPVPVAAAAAKEGTLPVFLTGIGNVTAINQVDIRPQVGGVLMQVPVKEGDEVKRGQVLAIIDPRPLQAALEKAKAQLTQDQAQLDNAQLDQKRYASLASRDFASRQQLDTQVATVQKLQGAIAADRASIDDAQLNLAYAVLKSPIDGRVGIRRVDPGNLLTANGTAAIITVVQQKPTSVIFTMPGTDVPQIRAAQAKGRPIVLALMPGSLTPASQGVLETLDNHVDTSSGTIQLRADFPNADEALVAGQFVDVRLQVDTAHGVIVPHTAIQHAQQSLFVYTVEHDNTVARHDVTVIYDDGEQTVLSKGVPAGAQVVTNGQSRIGTGSKVAINDGGNQPELSAAK